MKEEKISSSVVKEEYIKNALFSVAHGRRRSVEKLLRYEIDKKLEEGRADGENDLDILLRLGEPKEFVLNFYQEKPFISMNNTPGFTRSIKSVFYIVFTLIFLLYFYTAKQKQYYKSKTVEPLKLALDTLIPALFISFSAIILVSILYYFVDGNKSLNENKNMQFNRETLEKLGRENILLVSKEETVVEIVLTLTFSAVTSLIAYNKIPFKYLRENRLYDLNYILSEDILQKFRAAVLILAVLVLIIQGIKLIKGRYDRGLIIGDALIRFLSLMAIIYLISLKDRFNVVSPYNNESRLNILNMDFSPTVLFAFLVISAVALTFKDLSELYKKYKAL